MARPNRSEVFSPDEPSIVHVISRVVRRCSIGPLAKQLQASEV
ncbi:MAG: hypothetical protein R3C09_13280 [Pirellulaceae bacterium]